MVLVGTDAGRVTHHMGNVVLLVDAMQQVRHGTLGEDRDVLPTMGLIAQGHSRLRLVVVVSCGPEETLAESLPGGWALLWLFPALPCWLECSPSIEDTRLGAGTSLCARAVGFGAESVLTQKPPLDAQKRTIQLLWAV